MQTQQVIKVNNEINTPLSDMVTEGPSCNMAAVRCVPKNY